MTRVSAQLGPAIPTYQKVGLSLSFSFSPFYSAQLPPPSCDLKSITDRFDCHPDGSATEHSCLARGCCWSSADPRNAFDERDRAYLVPRCFFPTGYRGYKVASIEKGYDRLSLRMIRRRPSGVDVDVKKVDVNVIYYDRNTVRIKVNDGDLLLRLFLLSCFLEVELRCLLEIVIRVKRCPVRHTSRTINIV